MTPLLDALQLAYDSLPLDDDLPTPKAVEANFVRRSSLNQYVSRLRIGLQRLEELELKSNGAQQWLTILQECHRDLAARLLAETDDRTFDALRHALRSVSDGPERVGPHEFISDVLRQWFESHNFQPPFFDGRGGLRSTEARLATLTADIAQARADVDATLQAAQALVVA